MRIPHPANPFRPADWRHQRCAHLAESRRSPSRHRDDAPTWSSWRYLAAMRHCKDDRGRERISRRHPILDAAHKLRFGGDELTRCGIEGYLLAGVAPPEIDDRFRLTPGTALAFAEQFFDVRGCLHAHDYIVNVVIGLHSRPLTEKDVVTFVRLFGLMGGRHVVDAVLDYYAHPVPPAVEVHGLGEEERLRLRSRLRVRVAIQARCLPEAGVDLRRWQTLSLLADRLGGAEEVSSGVRPDVAGRLVRAAA